MVYILLTVFFACLMVFFLRTQYDLRRRIAAQKNSPKEELVPRHYKSFTELERILWAAVQDQKRDLEQVKFTTRKPEFQIIGDYIRGVRDDFRRAHNIWGQIILCCPEGKLFLQLEWERIKIEFVYYRWWLFSGLGLRTAGVSMGDLRQLTDIVASASYRVRTLLNRLEQQGHRQFVDSILRQS